MSAPSTSQRLAEAMTRARRQWDSERRAGAAPIAVTAVEAPLTVAISREAGTNARAVAGAIAARLDWPLFDRELLQHLADALGTRPELLERLDEHKAHWFAEFLGTLSNKPGVSQSAYVRELGDLMRALAAKGRCIIVGRGAAQILHPATTLRVRLVAPLYDRVRAIQERRGLTPEKALEWISETDRERSSFVIDHFHKDPNDPGEYDLVLNTSRFTPEQCATFIVGLLLAMQTTAAVPQAACP